MGGNFPSFPPKNDRRKSRTMGRSDESLMALSFFLVVLAGGSHSSQAFHQSHRTNSLRSRPSSSIVNMCYRDADGKVSASFPTDEAYMNRNRRVFVGTAASLFAASVISGPPEPARAADDDDGSGSGSGSGHGDGEEMLEEDRARMVRQRLQERRALMQVSRTSESRQSYLDLSRQRAKLYNTTSRAADCSAFEGSVFLKLPCL